MTTLISVLKFWNVKGHSKVWVSHTQLINGLRFMLFTLHHTNFSTVMKNKLWECCTPIKTMCRRNLLTAILWKMNYTAINVSSILWQHRYPHFTQRCPWVQLLILINRYQFFHLIVLLSYTITLFQLKLYNMSNHDNNSSDSQQ